MSRERFHEKIHGVWWSDHWKLGSQILWSILVGVWRSYLKISHSLASPNRFSLLSVSLCTNFTMATVASPNSFPVKYLPRFSQHSWCMKYFVNFNSHATVRCDTFQEEYCINYSCSLSEVDRVNMGFSFLTSDSSSSSPTSACGHSSLGLNKKAPPLNYLSFSEADALKAHERPHLPGWGSLNSGSTVSVMLYLLPLQLC